MLLVINAILVTSQMMAIFFCAFFVVYLIARVLLPVERGLSKFVWAHTGPMKAVRPASSFKKFSQRHP